MTGDLDLRGIRVLLVDDDPTVRKVVGRVLGEWGAEVVAVENGPRGLVELKQAREEGKPYRFALLDTTLSGVNGFEVAERLRADRPQELARIILMLGDDATPREAERARQIGAGGCMGRPLSRAGLGTAIRQVLGPDAKTRSGAPDAPPRAFRVLVAEDYADARSLIQHFLAAPGFQIDAAENGKAALEHFRLAEYDVVLMDIQMPLYDGYWAIREIRGWERANGLSRTPVAAVTAYAMTEDAQKCLRAGFDGYLTKPLTKVALLAGIRRLVRRPLPDGASG